MFQRLKNAVDSRIAEEQARQKSVPSPVARSASAARRSTSSRTESPSSRPRKAKPKDNDATTARGLDPSEFEAAFVIEDESEEPSRVGTPSIDEKMAAVMGNSTAPEGAGGSEEEGKEKDDKIEKHDELPAVPVRPSTELPAEVRVKLRKLDKLEARYQELLRSYRIAHARAVSIEPFEKALKENTPISTIGDPEALVEYLNQLNLKGDMVMVEFKRVSTDRDGYKKKTEDAEAEAARLRDELALLRSSKVAEGPASEATSEEKHSPGIKSPVSSILRILSPKQKPEATSDNRDVSEEFFSYDDELPKLQAEVEDKAAEIESLKSQVSDLERSLAVAQDSSSDLVESLEKATLELNDGREASVSREALEKQIAGQAEEIGALQDKLLSTEAQLSNLRVDLARHERTSRESILTLQADIAKEKKNTENEVKSKVEACLESESHRDWLLAQIEEMEQAKGNSLKRVQELLGQVEALNKQLEEVTNHVEVEAPETPKEAEAPTTTGTGAAKKKNKKKKKAGNPAAVVPANNGATETTAKSVDVASPASVMASLETAITRLNAEVIDRDFQITMLQTKRKTEEDLREELENMQENLLNIGQEHVEAKEKIKELQAEKNTLTENLTQLEKEIELYKSQSKSSEQMELDLKNLAAEYEDLRLKSATLQTDLGAAQQLATSRYKDLTDLRDVLQHAQPELKALRAENASMKSAKEELATRTSELRRLEARETDLKADITSFKKQSADRESEIRMLNEKITQESNSRLRAEDQLRVAQRDLRKSEAEKIQFAASSERATEELTKLQDEAGRLRSRLRDLEEQVQKLSMESKNLRQEVELRGSQYNNAQGLLGSMRDQSAEMAMQLKEAKEQAESLEEELAEVQRLLSERTREGETMRRLLADVDDRADAKVREMRERMEAAIEERDRAEDEASTNARRRAREIDELKTKIRDYERDLKRATDDRDELAQSQKDWKRRREELEGVSENAAKEVNEIRAAMGELRDALDGNEKQARDVEKQRADLRRLLEEANQRYEKLQKEFKSLQTKQARANDVSSRSSIESARAGSPVAANGAAVGKMDYVYLKTILLQFLEQKDKKRQADLVRTVLGQLLHMDKKDQERWISVISAK